VTGDQAAVIENFIFSKFFSVLRLHILVHTRSAVIPESRPMPAQSKLDILLKWFQDNEIEWEKELIQVKDANNSLGVFAKTKVEEGLPGKLTFRNQRVCLNDSH